MTNTVGVIEVRTGPQGPAGADGVDGADGADGVDGTGTTILSLSDTPDAYTELDEAVLSVNQAATATVFRYSTPEWEDIRDYMSGGPRQIANDEDITSAVQAVVDAFGVTHNKVKIYFPRTYGGSSAGAGAVIFDPQAVTGINGFTNPGWTWLLDCTTIKLNSTWQLGNYQRMLGLSTKSTLPQFMKGPQPLPIIQCNGASWTGIAANPAQPAVHMQGRNCQIKSVSITGSNGATSGLKITFDSHLVEYCYLTSNVNDMPACHIEGAFWVNMNGCSFRYGGAADASACALWITATTTNVSGLIRMNDVNLVGAGVLFRTDASGFSVNNIVMQDVFSENQTAGQALINFDSSIGNIQGITFTCCGMADSSGSQYVVRNTGSNTYNINFEGAIRQGTSNKEFVDSTSNPINGLSVNEKLVSTSGDLPAGILQEYYGVGNAIAYGSHPRLETSQCTSARLICAPPAAPWWNLGTILQVEQDPANWTSGTVTTGVRGPDGSTNAGTVTAGNARCLSQGSFTPAVDDWILAGVWMKGTVTGTPVASVQWGMTMSAAGWTINGVASTTLAPNISGGARPSQDRFYNIDDNGWHFSAHLFRYDVVTGGAGTVRMELKSGGDFCYPCAVHVPNSAGMDQATMLYHMTRLTSSFGGKNSQGSVAGDIVLPDLNKLVVAGGVRTAGMLVTNATSAYTLTIDDGCKTIEMANSSDSVVTIPPTTSAAIPVGTYYNIVRTGAGAVSVTTGSSVTLLSVSSARIINGQYAMATLYKSTGDTWILGGSVSTA